MPETPDLDSLIGTLQGTIGRSPMQSLSPLGQFGAAISGLGGGGQPNPVLSQIQGQQDAQLRQQIQLMQIQQTVQRQRMEKTRLQLDIAKSLPDDTPDALRKKLQVYQQSGLISFSPQEIEQQVVSQQAKNIPGRLGAVIGALDQGMDPTTLPPALTSGIDINMLKALPKEVRSAIDPEGKKRLSEAMTKQLESAEKKLSMERTQRIQSGTAHPLDFLAEGAKTPEDLGARLVTNSIATGVPVPPEYRPFVTAYEHKKATTGVTKDVLAVRSALGDPIATQALHTLQAAEEGKKLVGEAPRPFLNSRGDTAPSQLSQKAAERQGYFLASSREEATVTGYPRAMQLLNNLADTMREVRDLGGFRTASGITGALQRYVSIPARRTFGDPMKLSAKLTLLNSQRGELIQALRFLDEKGNIAAKIWIPQLEGMSPEAGMYASYELLTKLEKQVNAGIKQTRLANMAGQVPGLPVILLSTSKEYQQLRAKGWTDTDIEMGKDAITIHGRPVIIIK